MKNKTGYLCLAGLIVMFLCNGACKTEDETENGAEYNIVGNWQVSTVWAGSSTPVPGTFTITFSGTAVNGTFTNSNNEVGTYLVIGTAVQWIFSHGAVYTGQFTGEATMEGEMVGSYGNTGTWSATKSDS